MRITTAPKIIFTEVTSTFLRNMTPGITPATTRSAKGTQIFGSTLERFFQTSMAFGGIPIRRSTGEILMLLVPFILPLPMTILGLFSGLIQAYIFAVLTIIFVSSVSPDLCDDIAV